ncbi:KpsF/GutQ family sugar-phosphate isomerase [Rurimicrobium arvi]|uniref:KpsF/GutQ family sugar-phosphate isomerase n=1 Tax=Rurimicrobium arvi TaxID=2049916 RepID=A0ABP8ML20_9BACT
MFSKDQVIRHALESIELQAVSVAALAAFANDAFAEAVHTIHHSKGRLVISGIGKSAIIAQKIVATMNSTGTPALYMHAADAIHGDLGMVQEDDVVMIISKSGESAEIKFLVPVIRNFGNPVIALCGNEHGYLAREADIWINCTVEKEACPNNLAPTTSTTAQMVMGDALAVCLLRLKGFSGKDFARYHPGGALGKKLYLRVKDLIRMNEVPVVRPGSTIREVIMEISGKRLGATAVLNEKDDLLGIITDGDIRRMLQRYADVDPLKAADILSSDPKTIDEDELAVQALELMRQHDITQLPATREGRYVGMLHLHDLVREGII